MNKFKQATNELLKVYLLREIKKNHKNLSTTAKRIGLHRTTLLYLIDNLGIKKEYKKLGVAFRTNPRARKTTQNKYTLEKHRLEKKYLKECIKQSGGVIVKVARMNGVHRNAVIYKIQAYDLQNYVDGIRRNRRKGIL